MPVPANSPAEVYRFFSDDGTLLYIGATSNSLKRLYNHCTNSSWYPKAVTMKVERFPTKQAALAAEKEAIKLERPIHNSQHKPRKYPRVKRQPNKARLNHFLIKNLKPQSRFYLVWDTQQRGLVIHVQPTGYKAWLCIYSFHGRPRWYRIAAVSAIGLAQARRLANEVMYHVAQGPDPHGERRAASRESVS